MPPPTQSKGQNRQQAASKGPGTQFSADLRTIPIKWPLPHHGRPGPFGHRWLARDRRPGARCGLPVRRGKGEGAEGDPPPPQPAGTTGKPAAEGAALERAPELRSKCQLFLQPAHFSNPIRGFGAQWPRFSRGGQPKDDLIVQSCTSWAKEGYGTNRVKGLASKFSSCAADSGTDLHRLAIL